MNVYERKAEGTEMKHTYQTATAEVWTVGREDILTESGGEQGGALARYVNPNQTEWDPA